VRELVEAVLQPGATGALTAELGWRNPSRRRATETTMAKHRHDDSGLVAVLVAWFRCLADAPGRRRCDVAVSQTVALSHSPHSVQGLESLAADM